ncbi:MAG: tyrosine-type recombinase/integrase [Promethearchaeota archaeon]
MFKTALDVLKMRRDQREEEIKVYNAKLINKYLQRFAPLTQARKLRAIRMLLDYMYTNIGIKYYHDYTIDDFEQIFLFIEKKNIRHNTKNRYRLELKNLYIYSIRDRIANHKNNFLLYDFVFSDEFFVFSESANKREIIALSKKDILDFIEETRKNIDDYIWFSLLIFSGCRVGGLCNLIIKDIDFKQDIFQTQEKKTSASSGFNRYFLPHNFMDELKVYILRKQLGKDAKLCPITPKQVRIRLRRYRHQWWPHLFRHTLRVQWHLAGMPDTEAEMLLNHKVKNIQEVYLQQLNNIDHLRGIYDRYFPYY